MSSLTDRSNGISAALGSFCQQRSGSPRGSQDVQNGSLDAGSMAQAGSAHNQDCFQDLQEVSSAQCLQIQQCQELASIDRVIHDEVCVKHIRLESMPEYLICKGLRLA